MFIYLRPESFYRCPYYIIQKLREKGIALISLSLTFLKQDFDLDQNPLDLHVHDPNYFLYFFNEEKKIWSHFDKKFKAYTCKSGLGK